MTSEASPSARFVPVADVLLDHPAVHTQLGRDADDHHVVKDGQYISYTETSFPEFLFGPFPVILFGSVFSTAGALVVITV